LVARGRRAWPGIEVAEAGFLQYAAERVLGDGASGAALAEAHAGDLYLAYACSCDDPIALDEFERRFLSQVPSYVRTVDPSPAFADEVTQLLRKKLFVAEGTVRPKIADYAARGPLGAWVRVAAIRAARDLLRRQQRRGRLEREHGLELRPAIPDPELQCLKGRCGQEFRAAFQTTLASLPFKERNILCLYFLEGMSSSAIGALYHVQGATVRLWIKQSRENILQETRRLLRERLGIETAELPSLLSLVESQLDLSITRFLKKTDPDQ
jgi:RNA polymerase sigma-70 factor (ECF subfamily)